MKISHKSGRANKIHIYIDDEYAITTNISFWNQHYFNDGAEIDEEEWQELVNNINLSKALNKCDDLLSRRNHSVKELRDKLLKSFDTKTAEEAISRMLEGGYLDDEAYAAELLDYLKNDKKMSKSFIILEMRKRGISGDIIDSVIDSAEIDNVSSAYEIICSKYIRKLNEVGGRNKVISAMARKGFSYHDTLTALEMIENNDEI